MDEDDVPLTGYAAYFADQKSFQEYAKTLDPKAKEVRREISYGEQGLTAHCRHPHVTSSTQWDTGFSGGRSQEW